MASGSWQEWSGGWRASDRSLGDGKWNKTTMEEEKTEPVRMERSEGVMDAVVNGRVTLPSLSGGHMERNGGSFDWVCLQPRSEYFCALTGKPMGDMESEYAKKSGPRRLYEGERLCVPRCDKLFPIKVQGQAGKLEAIMASLLQS